MSEQHQPSSGPTALLRVTLPLPPSINEQYATTSHGHRVSTAVARRFKRQVKDALRSLEQQGILTEALCGRFRHDYLALSLEFYFETPLKRDLDGGLKITQDALCEYLGANDNRVVDIHLTKRIDPLHPHLDVELEALPDWQFDQEFVVLLFETYGNVWKPFTTRLPQCQLLHDGKVRRNRYTYFTVLIMQHIALRHWSVWPKPGNIPSQYCG